MAETSWLWSQAFADEFMNLQIKVSAGIIIIAVALAVVIYSRGADPEVKLGYRVPTSEELSGVITLTPEQISHSPFWTTETARTFSDLRSSTTRNLTISAGKGSIQISIDTGKVTLENVTLDEASRQFWDVVGDSYKDFQKAVIAGYQAKHEQDRLRDVEWQDKNGYTFNGKLGRMGVRNDGVMLWKAD